MKNETQMKVKSNVDMNFKIPKRYLVTGGAGFIGGTFVDLLLNDAHTELVVCLDKLTYAAREDRVNLHQNTSVYKFVHGDICDVEQVQELLEFYKPDCIVNFAAESHVDNSLIDHKPFYRTNVEGVKVLLDSALKAGVNQFVQISTDEVYGQRYGDELFKENADYNPRNPYSKSKCEAEKIVKDFQRNHGINTLITRGCNTFGPWQHKEKLIPKVISNTMQSQKIPVYGDGKQEREWIAAADHAGAVLHLIQGGYFSDVFNINTGYTHKNIDVVKMIIQDLSGHNHLIEYVKDRKNHDEKYGICGKRLAQTGWSPKIRFEDALSITIEFYKKDK